MTTLLSPPRSSSAASSYNHYAPPHYSALESVRRPYYPTSPSASEPRRHDRQASSGIISPITPAQRVSRTPAEAVGTQALSSASTSARAAAAAFHVLASSPSTQTAKPIKGPWTPSEDRRLLALVNELGAEKWVVIASRLGSRTGKQCRERWHNHVNPVLNKAPFSPEEEEAIERYYAEIGPKWAEIAKKLPGRSMSPADPQFVQTNAAGDNAVKNYWNTTMQRKYRRSLSAQSTLAHATPRRYSQHDNWQCSTPQGPARNSSPVRALYHPYAHHPRTPPATPDRAKTHPSPQTLPPLLIPHYPAQSSRSPYSVQHAPYSAETSPSSYGSHKILPDIHTVFASPSPSPNNLQLPPLQHRSLSEPTYAGSDPVSVPASPAPTLSHEIQDHVKSRMCLDTLLS